MRIAEFVEYLRNHPDYRGQIVHEELLPARPAVYAQLDGPLPPDLERALEERSALPLYAHQAKAISTIRQGEHAIITTGTALWRLLIVEPPSFERIRALSTCTKASPTQ